MYFLGTQLAGGGQKLKWVLVGTKLPAKMLKLHTTMVSNKMKKFNSRRLMKKVFQDTIKKDEELFKKKNSTKLKLYYTTSCI